MFLTFLLLRDSKSVVSSDQFSNCDTSKDLEISSGLPFNFENFIDNIRLIARDNQSKINDIIENENNLNIKFDDASKIEDIRTDFLQNYNNINVLINNNVLKIKITDNIYYKTDELILIFVESFCSK